MRMRSIIGLGALLAVVACPATTWGQSEPGGKQSFTSLINVNTLIDNYARFLARKYDLTEEQDAFTRQLIQQRAAEFLAKHEGNLRRLVDRMFEVRMGGEMDPAELVAWGKEILPIYEEAKAVIVSGNSEWREILTDEQRRMHDEDLRLMNESFKTTQEQLQKIVTGQMTIEEFRNAGRQRPARPGSRIVRNPPIEPPAATPDNPQPAPPSNPGQVPSPPPAPEPPPDPANPEAGEGQPQPMNPQPPEVQPPVIEFTPGAPQPAPAAAGGDRPHAGGRTATPTAGANYESEWDAYVRQFIERYKLNEAQTQRAHAILKDCKDEAARHMKRQTSAFERLDKRMAELRTSTDANRAKELAALGEERRKLMEPIGQIFEQQLKPRLERLPTRAQRQEAEAAAKKAGGAKTAPAPPQRGKPGP